MLASFLAATFFALNATCASHSVRASGSARANLGRLIVAAAVLGLFAHTLGHGFTSASVGWFFLSGLIGMGLTDTRIFSTVPIAACCCPAIGMVAGTNSFSIEVTISAMPVP